MRDLRLSDASGHYFESYIISEIVKNYQNLGVNAHFFKKRKMDSGRGQGENILYNDNQ